MELYYQTYEFNAQNIFNIPEEVQYPIFNDENAKMIFDEESEENKEDLSQYLFLGEAAQTPDYANYRPEEVNFSESHFLDFECTSPKFEDMPEQKQTVRDVHVMTTAESGNLSFENMVKLTKKRMQQVEDYESGSELTGEVTEDQELKMSPVKAPAMKSRFSRNSAPENKTQNLQNGVVGQKTTRRRSSRPKLAKSDTIASEEGSTSVKGISLAKRKDVVNKTLLRSVKRYYTSLFEHFMKENQYSKQEKREFWKEYIEEFTKSISGDYIETITPESGICLKEVNAFMASMIVPNNIKRTNCEEVYTSMMEEFSNLLYKYSIKRLGSFVRNPSVKYVLKHYIERGPLEELLENDVTLSKNRSLYTKASKEILSMHD